MRYFEKENGGVSTALNLGIQNMRGQYFSWLSHDDIYLPEKVQVEIDALRKAGDMSRVVYSNDFTLHMPDRKIVESTNKNFYRQDFLETGALTTLFGFASGCTFLIPKFYFDAYGGFDETFRAVQDYKKWFEMFRGKRLVYVRQALVLVRQHSEQTTHRYSIRVSEEQWLYSWMVYNLNENDLVGSGLMDLYHLCSALYTKYFGSPWLPYRTAIYYLTPKIIDLPESPDADDRAEVLREQINDSNFETYLPAEQESLLRLDFNLRGVNLGDNVKFIPYKQFANVKPARNIRLLTRESLMQVLIDVPIRKQLFAQWLQRQGGQPA